MLRGSMAAGRRATPKSDRWGAPASSRRTLAGFRSRWMNAQAVGAGEGVGQVEAMSRTRRRACAPRAPMRSWREPAADILMTRYGRVLCDGGQHFDNVGVVSWPEGPHPRGQAVDEVGMAATNFWLEGLTATSRPGVQVVPAVDVAQCRRGPEVDLRRRRSGYRRPGECVCRVLLYIRRGEDARGRLRLMSLSE